MLQNQGLTAPGDPGGSLGYSGSSLTTPGIAPSAGLGFNIFTGGQNGASSLYQLSGGTLVTSVPTTNSVTPSTSVNLDSGDPIKVSLSYDGSNNLTVTLSDSTAGSSYTNTFPVGSLATLIGNTAWHGLFRRRRRIKLHAENSPTSASATTRWRSTMSCPRRRPFRSPPRHLDLAGNRQ